MGKTNIHDVNGETYILSDGVNLEDIDLENMTDNSEPTTVNITYPIVEENSLFLPDTTPIKEEERIWIEIFLNFVDKTHASYTGILDRISFKENKYNDIVLLVERKQARKIVDKFMQEKYNLNKIVLEKYKSFFLDEESVFEFNKSTCFVEFMNITDDEPKKHYVKVIFTIK